MEKGTSFLFSGITFNRKKFARDFARFEEKNETDAAVEEPDLIENESSLREEEPTVRIDKKRNRKQVLSESVEGFSVFKSSKSKAAKKANDKDEDKLLLGRKEYHKQMERDAIFRKKHNIHVSGSNIPSPLQSFTELRSRHNCRSFLVRNLAELGFKEPTPIQRQAIPVLLSGMECFACAPTGSGKTFAFVCPILMKLGHHSKDGIRAVILCPTRELAAQTARECKKLCKGKKFYIKLMTKQLAKSAEFSKQPCDILISTAFRVKVEYLVLDEADKLFELGLVKEVDAVVNACSYPSIVRSLFSAILPDTVEELARTIMHDAVQVIIGRKNSASESIKQKLVFVGSEEGKLLVLRQSFAESLNPLVLIFVQNKERAKELYNELRYDEIRADVIHADLSEAQMGLQCSYDFGR